MRITLAITLRTTDTAHMPSATSAPTLTVSRRSADEADLALAEATALYERYIELSRLTHIPSSTDELPLTVTHGPVGLIVR